MYLHCCILIDTGTGLLSKISSSFAMAGIPLYYMSTAQTDFMLVSEVNFLRLLLMLQRDLDNALLTLNQSYHVMRDFGDYKETISQHTLTSDDGSLDSTLCQQTLVTHLNDNPTVFKVFINTKLFSPHSASTKVGVDPLRSS